MLLFANTVYKSTRAFAQQRHENQYTVEDITIITGWNWCARPCGHAQVAMTKTGSACDNRVSVSVIVKTTIPSSEYLESDIATRRRRKQQKESAVQRSPGPEVPNSYAQDRSKGQIMFGHKIVLCRWNRPTFAISDTSRKKRQTGRPVCETRDLGAWPSTKGAALELSRKGTHDHTEQQEGSW